MFKFEAFFLLLAACLEVGGDALVRIGMKSYHGLPQILAIGLGALVLLGYGIFVNIAPIDFGRALGGYVVLFFVVAQIANFFFFNTRPDMPILVGGACICIGGAVMMLWKSA